MSNLQVEEQDVATANAAWTQQDVTLSMERIDRGHLGDNECTILTQEIKTNPDPSLQVIGLDKGIRTYWKKYGDRFSSVWKGMTTDARIFLLLTVAPHMAKTYHDQDAMGQLLLIPELVVSDLSSQDEALLKVIGDVLSQDLLNHYERDVERIQQLIREGLIHPDQNMNGYLAFLHGRSHVGEILELNMERADQEARQSINNMIRSGIAVIGPVFSHVLSRRLLLYQTLAFVMDEMKSLVFDARKRSAEKNISTSTNPLQCSLPSCSNTQWIGGDGRPKGPLTPCARCKHAAYCSKQCQSKHWKKHKQTCSL